MDTFDLLRTALRHDDLPPSAVRELLRKLTDTTVRDAAIAVAGGLDGAARDLLAGTQRSHSWVMVGPLRAPAVAAARPRVDQLEVAGRRSGPRFAHAPTVIGAWLDWCCGEPAAATLRLRGIPREYSMAHWLRYHLAIGTPAPKIIDADDPNPHTDNATRAPSPTREGAR